MLVVVPGFSVVLGQLLTFERNALFTGVMVGAMIGVLSVGIVLVYRSSRVINFAYGEVGVFGAMLAALLMLEYGWSYWLAVPLAILAGGLLSLVIELTVVRRLFDAPRVILFVATLGVALVVRVATLALPDISSANAKGYPTPFFVQPSRDNPDATYDLFGVGIPFDIWDISVRSRHLMVLLFVPLVVIGLSYFMNRTLHGLCIQAAAGNADAARLAGVRPMTMSSIVWTLAGMLSVLTVILLMPLLSIAPGPVVEVVGPSLLLRALVAALAARMASLPVAFGAGIAIGVLEEVTRLSVRPDRALLNNPGVYFLLLFVLVLILVVFVAGRVTTAAAGGTFSFAPKVKPIPQHLQSKLLLRWMPQILAAIGLAIALLLPEVMGIGRLERMAAVFTVALIGLSVTVLTGWAGQLSLGQFAIAGVGAFTTARLSGRGVPGFADDPASGLPFWLAAMLAVMFCVVVAMLVGAPALRVQGLFLAVTTFAFAVFCDQWLFGRDVFIPTGQSSVPVERGSIGPVDVSSSRAYYYACLLFLILAVVVVARIRRSGIGRTLIAVRDNEASAAAFTVSPRRAKLTAFAVSGALAGLAGALTAGLNRNVNELDYEVTDSLDVVAMTIVGGVGSVAGPLLGALWVKGLPVFVNPSQQVNFLRSGIGLLIILMYFPGGFVQIGYALRGVYVRFLERRNPVPEAAPIERSQIPASASRAALDADVPALAVKNLSVSFGANRAVSEVNLHAMPGEVVGLIGGNGAGKSTLMNAVGGFVPSTGQIQLLGSDISDLSSPSRASRGLGRTFQAAELFAALTVRETVMVALEARERSTLGVTLLGGPPHVSRERRKRADASALVDFVGLGRYADSFISELSTGTRRICELACLLALDAQVLCLDEPTAGVAQRETEAFGPLIKRIQQELGATLVVIEHDMPLIMSISDRVYCLEVGKLIAEGNPDQVRNNPSVIASYLGTDERAIERSGPVSQ